MDINSFLIVDDNQDDRYILIRTLKSTHLSTRYFEATNGQEAIEFLEEYQDLNEFEKEKNPPLVIFLDINMPIMNGFQFLEAYSKLRSTNSHHGSTIIMTYSSSESKEDLDKVQSYSFVKSHIIKGNVDSEDLKETILKSVS